MLTIFCCVDSRLLSNSKATHLLSA